MSPLHLKSSTSYARKVKTRANFGRTERRIKKTTAFPVFLLKNLSLFSLGLLMMTCQKDVYRGKLKTGMRVSMGSRGQGTLKANTVESDVCL